MDELVFWTWVVGGTPLALALGKRAVDWVRNMDWLDVPYRPH
jgi:hypothetical protein